MPDRSVVITPELENSFREIYQYHMAKFLDLEGEEKSQRLLGRNMIADKIRDRATLHLLRMQTLNHLLHE